MSAVGAFPGIELGRRRTTRATINPYDKSTIFSIYPKPINERHWTIMPGFFHIDPGTYKEPARLVVGSSSWWREIDETQPLLEIPNSSVQVADAVVKNYCSGLLGCNMANAMPGLFWLPGEVSLIDLITKEEFKAALELANKKQRTYYTGLIKMADTLWAKTNGNPLCISDDMRLAARELGGEKDWTKDFSMIERISCVACGQPRNPAFPICPNCKNIIDVDKAKALNLKFAE
jgi:hypothetical protein